MIYKKILIVFSLSMFVSLMAFVPETMAQSKLEKAAALNEACLRCHGAQGLKVKIDGKVVSLWVDEQEFRKSPHGTSACTTCHVGFTDFPHVGANKGKALIKEVNARCQKCHADVNEVFVKSVHGKALVQGKETAYCSNCHGFHNIRKPQDPQATVFKTNIPHTCTKCHDHRIAESYEESFHGKAVIMGSANAASCVDCHGKHDILGPQIKASPVNKSNIPQTCAKCHRVPFSNYAKGTEHFLLDKEGPGKPMFYTLKFFVWLTIIVNALLIIHMEMELYRKLKNALKARRT